MMSVKESYCILRYINTNNTVVRGATLGLAARWESELTMNYTTILSSWANPVYLLDAGDVFINHSFIRDSGGSAIYVEDAESVITKVEKEKDENGKDITVPVYETATKTAFTDCRGYLLYFVRLTRIPRSRRHRVYANRL